ncbi:MAG: HlyD family efflux transporter periplasmic adaptor subunit [Pseudomonadales bacterium]
MQTQAVPLVEQTDTESSATSTASGSQNLNRLAQQWLHTQCAMVKELHSAQVLCYQIDNRQLLSLSHWPQAIPEFQSVPDTIVDCLQSQQHSITTLNSGEQNAIDQVCYPLLRTSCFVFVVHLNMRARNELMQRSVLNMLQWGSHWFRFAYLQPEQAASVSHMSLWTTAARCLEQQDLTAMSSCMVSELATQLRCTRVSYGRWNGKRLSVTAISHSANFSRKTEAIQRLSAAMKEAIEHDRVIHFPDQTEQSSPHSLAHQLLCDSSANGSLCTVPIGVDGSLFAALTLERPAEKPFSSNELDYVQHLSALLANTLSLHQEQQLNIAHRGIKKIQQLTQKLGRKGNGSLKLKVAAALLVALFLTFAKGEHRVTAPAIVEGKVQRAVVAPLDGFLSSSNVRAGDSVKAQQLMGLLDDKDLKLEQLSITSEQQELVGAYREAMAEHDSAKVAVIAAQIDQANARMQLINEQLKRTRLMAPFDGIIIEGDLSQSLGSPVNKGDVLFKVAPLADYRIVLNVDEKNIAGIESGLNGTLVLTSLPGERRQLVVEKVTSVSIAEDASNYFRVEARISEDDAATPAGQQDLRPGMEGAAKLDLGERSLVWIWTHELINWLRLKAWVWLP